MINLRLLGGVSLERDGRSITGRAAQRHPTALLVLLASAPTGSMTRDKLLGHLWPDDGSRAARHRLSVVLHVVRKELGKEAVLSRGDTVELDPTLVGSDVRSFQSAIERGDLAEAVALYRGPFLDGFFLPDVQNFDFWMEGERERLARLQAGALEQLAREAVARGAAAAATTLWKRLGAHRPFSGRIALDVARGLEAVGDRTAALQHLRMHGTLLRSELAIDPDPEVVELAERLATTSQPPAVDDAPGEDVPDPEAGTVPESGAQDEIPEPPAAAPFSPWRPWRLAVPLALLLAILVGTSFSSRTKSLEAEGSPLRVSIPAFTTESSDPATRKVADGLHERILQTLAWVPGVERDSDDRTIHLPRPATETAGGPFRLEGRVEGDASGYTVSARLVSARGPEWSVHYRARPGDPEAVREEISLAVANGLREHIVPFRPKEYTRDEEAYDRFLSGVWEHRKSAPPDLWKALQYYREALERDSTLALAHATASRAYLSLSGSGADPEQMRRLARHEALRALELDTTLAEGHVALADTKVWPDPGHDEAAEAFRRAIMLYPTLPQALSGYGHHLLYVLRRPEAAIEYYRRALEADPLHPIRSTVVEWALFYAGRYDDVIEQHRTTRSLSPELDFPHDRSALADALRELGRQDEAMREYRRLQERSGGVPPAGLGVLHASAGRTGEARTILRHLHENHGPASAVGRAGIHAALAEPDRAIELLVQALAERDWNVVAITVDPVFDPLRHDPRFGELLRRLGVEGPGP